MLFTFKLKNNALVNKSLLNQHELTSMKLATSLFVISMSVLDILNFLNFTIIKQQLL
jgi:hypothetical protein